MAKLYWTSIQGRALRAERYQPLAEQHLRLPELFWTDLRKVIFLVLVTNSSLIEVERKSAQPPRQHEFIANVRNLIAKERQQQTWTTENLNKAQLILADALTRYGEYSMDNAAIGEALGYYEDLLARDIKATSPDLWAKIQNNLGIALNFYARDKTGIEELTKAIAAFNAALEIWSVERTPAEWANTQSNLGTALAMVGERTKDIRTLEKAVAAYDLALQQRTRGKSPLDWAMTQSSRGNALGRIAMLDETNVDRLEEAAKNHRLALEEWTRETVPVDWARTQHNLGNVLRLLGERTNDTSRFSEAIEAYAEALAVFQNIGMTRYAEIVKNSIDEVNVLLGDGKQTAN